MKPPRELDLPIMLDEFLVKYKWWNPDALVKCSDGVVNLADRSFNVKLEQEYLFNLEIINNPQFLYWNITVKDIS